MNSVLEWGKHPTLQYVGVVGIRHGRMGILYARVGIWKGRIGK